VCDISGRELRQDRLLNLMHLDLDHGVQPVYFSISVLVNKRLVTNIPIFLHGLPLTFQTVSRMKSKVLLFDSRPILQRLVCDVRSLNRGDNIRCAVCHTGLIIVKENARAPLQPPSCVCVLRVGVRAHVPCGCGSCDVSHGELCRSGTHQLQVRAFRGIFG
jgi:hypothetical protein